jgi:hypothetical protein
MLVCPGKDRLRKLGYGIRPEFVQGGRAIRFCEFVRPPAQMDLKGDYSRVVTMNLRTGRKTLGAERTAAPDRIEMPSDQPASRWYWPDRARRGSKPDYSAMTAVYVSEVGSAKRRLVARLPAGCNVDEVYETRGGPLALMYRRDGGLPAGRIVRLAAPRKALYTCRRAAQNDAAWCTVTLLPDGKLLLGDTIQSFSPSPWKLSIRWSILDSVSGRATPLAWSLPASETAGGYTFSVSRDGPLVAIGADAPNVAGSYAGRSRVLVFRFGEKKPMAQWSTLGYFNQLAWAPDGSALVASIYTLDGVTGRPAPAELVYLRLRMSGVRP